MDLSFHTPNRYDNPMLLPFGPSGTLDGCKTYCMDMAGARGVEVNSPNPSSSGTYSCICVWSVDLSVQGAGTNTWSCHELLIDGSDPAVGLESPNDLLASSGTEWTKIYQIADGSRDTTYSFPLTT